VPSPFDQLIDIIHSKALDSWKKANEKALSVLFGTRYPKRAGNSVTLRAPDMKGGDAGIPYAAYIHPANPESGAYGGMSFVIFPVDGEPCLVGMVIGTQGLSPDESILGRPGHARRMQAICAWLNRSFGHGERVAWAKQDPTRIDIPVPDEIRKAWSAYEKVFGKYGGVLYALYRPNEDREPTRLALTALLDVMFEERGFLPLREFEGDYQETRSAWFSRLMPRTTQETVVQLLNHRRYAILQGPPGTGKTRMARQILEREYRGVGVRSRRPRTSVPSAHRRDQSRRSRQDTRGGDLSVRTSSRISSDYRIGVRFWTTLSPSSLPTRQPPHPRYHE
jgi:5-methylcytosine-specific restriction protein B